MPLEITTASVDLLSNVPTLVVVRNPARRYLIVSYFPANTDFFLNPFRQSNLCGIGPPEGTSTVQLYRATLGELAGFDWYAISFTPGTLYYIDAWDA